MINIPPPLKGRNNMRIPIIESLFRGGGLLIRGLGYLLGVISIPSVHQPEEVCI